MMQVRLRACVCLLTIERATQMQTAQRSSGTSDHTVRLV
jgi:hypothetical protein